MDPEERDELLRVIDDELDDSPKGRAIKATIKLLAVNEHDEADCEADDEVDAQGF